jgi:inhibitor of Bruton tyrosine kinase
MQTQFNIVSSGKAWNQAPVQPLPTPSPSSFAAIQQLQLEQVAGPRKEKRSLREIQEEEKALQQEADFLAWWTAEEERIRLEAEGAAAQVALPKPTKERRRKADQVGRGSRSRGLGRKNDAL